MRRARHLPALAALAALLALLAAAHAPSAWAQAAPAGSASPAPAGAASSATPPPAATVELGRKAYTSYCTRCHGINLVVSGGAFYDLRTFPKDDKARFVRSVTQGVRAMPAWGGTLKPEEIESLWLYIGSVNGWPREP